jgi:hypothetical protein
MIDDPDLDEADNKGIVFPIFVIINTTDRCFYVIDLLQGKRNVLPLVIR